MSCWVFQIKRKPAWMYFYIMLTYINTNILNDVLVTKAIYPKTISVDSDDCHVTPSVHNCLKFRYQLMHLVLPIVCNQWRVNPKMFLWWSCWKHSMMIFPKPELQHCRFTFLNSWTSVESIFAKKNHTQENPTGLIKNQTKTNK